MTANQLVIDIVDTDLTTVLFSFASGGCEIISWNWGAVEPETDYVAQKPFPGAILADATDPLVTGDALLNIQGSSSTNLRDKVALLAGYLRQGGVFRFKPDTAATYRYVHFFPAERAPILRGDEDDLGALTTYNIDYPFSFVRWPYFFRPKANLVAAQALSYTAPTVIVNNVADVPSEAKLGIQVDTADVSCVDFLFARKSGTLANLNEFATLAYNDLTGTPSANNNQWDQDWVRTLVPASGLALAGTYMVIARVSFPTVSGESGGFVQLKYAQTSTGPAGLSNPPVYLDTSDLALLNIDHELPLGYVTFDRYAPALTLEGWSKKVPIDWKSFLLVPADEQTGHYTSPGLLGLRQFSPLVWDGPDFELQAGAVLNGQDEVTLDADGEIARTDAFQLLGGLYVATFIGHIENPDSAAHRLGSFILSENGADTNTQRINTERRRRLGYHHRYPPCSIAWKVTDPTVLHRLRVEYTETNVNVKGSISVDRVVVGFIPTISSGRFLVSDGIGREEWIGTATERYWPVNLRGPYLELEPGYNLLMVRAGRFYANGYDKVRLKGPILRTDTTWTPKVTVDVLPRDSH